MKIGFAISIYDSCGDTGQPCIEFLIGSRGVCSTAAGEITSFRSVCFQYYIIVKVKNMIILIRYSIIILIFLNFGIHVSLKDFKSHFCLHKL